MRLFSGSLKGFMQCKKTLFTFINVCIIHAYENFGIGVQSLVFFDISQVLSGIFRLPENI